VAGGGVPVQLCERVESPLPGPSLQLDSRQRPQASPPSRAALWSCQMFSHQWSGARTLLVSLHSTSHSTVQYSTPRYKFRVYSALWRKQAVGHVARPDGQPSQVPGQGYARSAWQAGHAVPGVHIPARCLNLLCRFWLFFCFSPFSCPLPPLPATPPPVFLIPYMALRLKASNETTTQTQTLILPQTSPSPPQTGQAA